MKEVMKMEIRKDIRGMNDWAIWCYCYNCPKVLFIKPNSDDHEKIIDQMKGYLKHSQCPEG